MKETIVRETFKLLMQKGLNGISISEIQNAANCSRAVIYHHFENKEDLILYACKVFFLERYRLDEALAKEISFYELLLHTLKIRDDLLAELEIEKTNKNSTQSYNILFYQASQKYPILMQDLAKDLDRHRHVIERAKKSGEIKKNFDSDFLARMFFYVFDGASNYIIRNSEKDFRAAMKNEIKLFYELVRK